MNLHRPFVIGPRLLPALKLADIVWLSYKGVKPGREHRQAATMILDIDGRTYTDDRMQSGQGGFRGMVTIFESYLGYLDAALESYPGGENADLFPAWVLDALGGCEDAIGALRCELTDEEGRGIVREELIEE